MGNLFILGYSGTGKTTLSHRLKEQMPALCPISASTWVREAFAAELKASKLSLPPAYRETLTQYACQKLSENPDACVEYILDRHPIHCGMFIIEGIRNPHDFNRLFNPSKDTVFLLDECSEKPGDWSSKSFLFEYYGLTAIKAILTFYTNCGLISSDQVKTFNYASWEELNSQYEKLLTEAYLRSIFPEACEMTKRISLEEIQGLLEGQAENNHYAEYSITEK